MVVGSPQMVLPSFMYTFFMTVDGVKEVRGERNKTVIKPGRELAKRKG